MDKNTVLEMKGIEKAFDEKKVHQGVSLTLTRGELVGLFGGSGTGKSVLIRSIIGLEKPDAGEIWFEGKDLTKLSERKMIPIRRKIGFVFQNGALFDSMTVEDNLAYPLREHTKLSESEIMQKVEQMLELIDMKGSNQLLPNELSGGMQKRAGLARATILEPEIILFDEPTAGLDPVNTKRLVDNVKKLKEKGITGIFVTHDIPAAFEICDKIAMLKDGKMYAFETVDTIRKSTDPYIQSFVQGAAHK
ncbi:MAG: ATP-binding cassette domain-containing protein [Proteobacteria bacterium]|nr:MAG: ATP-binding cassette domain-containing protein [Pseudomonadota bacterium]